MGAYYSGTGTATYWEINWGTYYGGATGCGTGTGLAGYYFDCWYA